MSGTVIKTNCKIEIQAFNDRIAVGNRNYLFLNPHQVCPSIVNEMKAIVEYAYTEGAKDKEVELVDRMQKILLGKTPII